VRELEVTANGFTFDAVATGPTDGRAVVFLHGFPQTSFSWHHQLDALGAAGYRALAFDQRGYSPRARPAAVADYRIDALVSDVLAVADALGLDRFDLVGHDWGAMVSWVVAGRHPGRVRTLSAVSVPHPRAFAAAFGGAGGDAGAGGAAGTGGEGGGDDDQRQRSSYIEVFRAEGGVAERALLGDDGSGQGLRVMFDRSGLSSDTDEVHRFVAAMLEPGALTAALNWYRATEPHAMSDVATITVPTLYVWSDEDIALGRAAAEATRAWVSGPYRFEVLSGVSHWIPETAPAELNRLLLEHLAAHD
jgi:pimeloyl-ACP methyl ester carboxylesterase